MARRIALIGQAPGPNNGRRRAFEGPCELRLAGLLGVSVEELRSRLRMTNLLDEFPGDAGRHRGKGDVFPLAVAREAARRKPLVGMSILAGRNVATAYGIRNALYFRWVTVGWSRDTSPVLVCVIPHPSGVNRWWQERANRLRARSFLRRHLFGSDWGMNGRLSA
jgi:uracil-DNA glycosylase